MTSSQTDSPLTTDREAGTKQIELNVVKGPQEIEIEALSHRPPQGTKSNRWPLARRAGGI